MSASEFAAQDYVTSGTCNDKSVKGVFSITSAQAANASYNHKPINIFHNHAHKINQNHSRHPLLPLPC